MGNKRGHKGGRRQFTNPQALERQKEKEEKEREWRRKRGEIVDTDEEDEESDEENSEEEDESSEEEKSSSEEEEEGAKEGEDDGKKKQPVVEVCNPNRLPQKQVNKRNLDSLVKEENKVELSRREREEIMKQNARANYNKLHAQGKTEEARADLARLAIIRQKREEAAKKRDADQKAANALEKAGSSKSKK